MIFNKKKYLFQSMVLPWKFPSFSRCDNEPINFPQTLQLHYSACAVVHPSSLFEITEHHHRDGGGWTERRPKLLYSPTQIWALASRSMHLPTLQPEHSKVITTFRFYSLAFNFYSFINWEVFVNTIYMW